MSQSIPPEPKTRSSWRWPVIVISLLVAHFILMMVTVLIATGDRSFTVLPKYYERALAWDQTQAKKRASDQLGWKLGIETGTRIDPLGKRKATMTLNDAEGKPVAGATADISYYHRTFAQQVETATLAMTAPGRFEMELPMRRTGFWEFRVLVKADGQEFMTDLTHFAKDAGR